MKRMLGIGMIVLGLAAAGLAQAQEAASLRLNWLYYGFHSFFPLGVEKGFYKEEGIDLTIGEGQGSGRAVQIVGAKSDTFGLSDGASVIAGAAKGAPVVAVMGIMNKSPFAIIARADANIRTVKDLEGKTIAATTGEAGLTIFPAIIKNNKLNADAIKFVRVDGPGKLVATLEKRVDAMLGGLENQSLILAQRGLAVTNIAYSDVGANTLGLVIHVNKETLEKNPKLVQGFIRATQKSIAYTEKNPEEAIAALAKIKPDLDKGLALQQLKAGLQLVRAKDGENRPIGWMNPADWETTLDMAREYQDLKTEMKATDFYVNNLVAAKQ
ncbi:ABC transporter substrate-binding protein [Propionivibrio sp.]|uniref:ABC transporter substrate-binding protein n=1 Tax=Propionivibrio sp. TaxID=2212460 RepID=UPI0039E481EB